MQARRLLGRAIQADPQNERAWLRLSDVVDSDQERLACLKQVLAINPGNEVARCGVAALRQKQASQPVKPVTPSPLAPGPTAATLDHSRTLDELSPEQREALESFANLIAHELACSRSRKEIVERLTKRGFPRKAVKQLVDKVARASKRARARKRII